MRKISSLTNFFTCCRTLFFLMCFLGVSFGTQAITITETLRDSKSDNFTFGGTPTAYLTSGKNDPVGDGWLRLTRDQIWQTGYAILNQSFSSGLGVLVDLEFMIWRTSSASGGADGISISLFDATTPTFNIGAFGGSLGYAQYINGATNKPGLSGGFLGLGIDEYGNYSNPTEGRVNGVGFKPNSIGLRGPASTDYAWITGSSTLSFNLQIGQYASRPTDASAYRRIQIEMTPFSGSSGIQYSVSARIKSSKNGLFATVFGPIVLPYTPPAQLKLALAASTGAQLNYHDVRNLMIATPGGVRITKTVDKSIVNIGGDLTYTVDLYNQTVKKTSGLKFSDVFSQASAGFHVDSVFFNNDGDTLNRARGYNVNDLSNVTIDLNSYSHSQFIIKGKVTGYPTGGRITNTANLELGTSGVDDPDMSNNTSTVSTQVLSQNEKISLVKTVSNSKQFKLGDEIKYNFTVQNPGEVDLSNIKITDSKLSSSPAYVSGDLNANAILEPGESWVYAGNYVVKQADIDSGKVINRAIVTSTDPLGSAVRDTSGNSASDNAPTVTPLTQNSKITLVKSVASTGSYKLGSTIRYSFAVSNAGNTTLSQVSLVDNKLTPPPVYQSGDINSNGKLDIGETWFYAGEYIVNQADILAKNVMNSAVANAKDPQGKSVTDISGSAVDNDNPTNTPIDQTGKIALVKSISNNGPFEHAGDKVKYIFTVTNIGNVSLSQINLSDSKLLNSVVYSGGDVNNNGILDVNENWIYTGSYAITQSDLDSGYVRNSALVTAKDPSGGVVQDVSGPTVMEDIPTMTKLTQNPNLALIKTVNNTGKFRLGDLIRYDFTVANTGNVTLSGVSLSDNKLLNTTTFVNGDNNGNKLLDVGEIWVFSGNYKVTQADVDSGKVVNSAIATAKDPDGKPVSDISGSTTINDQPTVTPISQTGKIALIKSVSSNGHFTLGSTIGYTFTVLNTGTVTLSGINLTDNKLANGLMYISGDVNGNGKLDINESWIYTGSYIVKQSDVDAGYVVNSATVVANDPQGNSVKDISGSAINSDNPTTVFVDQLARIALVKKVSNTGPFRIGSEIDYLFVVTNTGNVTLGHPVLSDTKLNSAPIYLIGDDNSNDKLDVGETWQFQCKYQVTRTDINNGSVINTALATAYDPQGNGVTDISGATIFDNNPTVTPVDQAPVAINDNATTKMDVAVSIPVLGNDLSGGGVLNPDSVQIINQPQHGMLTLNPDGSIIYTPEENYEGTDLFTYRVKDQNGFWSNVATVNITVLPNKLFIPNVFTPNADGKNDMFEIIGLDSYTGADLLIFNRWGNEVYHSSSYHNEWNGDGLNDGTYYYVLKLVKRGKESTYTGWVLIKR